MLIRDVLQEKGREVFQIAENETVHSAIKVLAEHNIGALLVMNDKPDLVGILSERDILRECVKGDERLRSTRAKAIMTKKVIVGLEDDEIAYSMNVMARNHIRHLPIMEKNRIAGLVTIGDLVKAQLREMETENRYLQQYLFGS